jgi:hypothetical protein
MTTIGRSGVYGLTVIVAAKPGVVASRTDAIEREGALIYDSHRECRRKVDDLSYRASVMVDGSKRFVRSFNILKS